MEIFSVIGILILIVLLFVGGGLLGWIIKGFELIFGLIFDGCRNTVGCIFWVFVGFCLLIALFS